MSTTVRTLPADHVHTYDDEGRYACNMRHAIVDSVGREVARGPEWSVNLWAAKQLGAPSRCGSCTFPLVGHRCMQPGCSR